jgi:hypothetical protein
MQVALRLFRGLVQKEIGFVSSLEGYDGLIEEARYYQMKPGVTKEDQQQMVPHKHGTQNTIVTKCSDGTTLSTTHT